MTQVPEFRIQKCNTAEVKPKGDYVLYLDDCQPKNSLEFQSPTGSRVVEPIEQTARDPGGSAMRLPMGI